MIQLVGSKKSFAQGCQIVCFSEISQPVLCLETKDKTSGENQGHDASVLVAVNHCLNLFPTFSFCVFMLNMLLLWNC